MSRGEQARHLGRSGDACSAWRAAPRHAAVLTLGSLIALTLAWELWLAPLRPGGSWLALKAIPLLAPLPGLFRGKRYTFQWSPLIVLPYAAEGIVRAWSESGLSAGLALGESLLATGFVVTAALSARQSGKTGHCPSVIQHIEQ